MCVGVGVCVCLCMRVFRHQVQEEENHTNGEEKYEKIETREDKEEDGKEERELLRKINR